MEILGCRMPRVWGGSRIALMMIVGLAICAPRAIAQNISVYAYTGRPFTVAACNTYQFGYFAVGFVCSAGNLTALATFNLPSASYSGCTGPVSITASALGATVTFPSAGVSAYLIRAGVQAECCLCVEAVWFSRSSGEGRSPEVSQWDASRNEVLGQSKRWPSWLWFESRW